MLRKIILAFIVFSPFLGNAQKALSDFALSGRVQNMEMAWVRNVHSPWPASNTTTNRLDLHYYPNNKLEAHIGMRNNFVFGSLLSENYPSYKNSMVADDGYLNMTWQLAADSAFVAYTNIDRANLNYTYGNLQFVAGRQRINWGINLVWNPNDIFNTFNYFDFDYTERPGCDGLRIQYYTGSTSSVQLAYKIDVNNESTFAGMYKFNKWNYDIQILGGWMPEDYVIGLGWSGQIEGAGFNGEFTYLIPKNDIENQSTENILIGSIGLNYTLPNSLYLHIAWMYNSVGATGKAGMSNIFGIGQQLSIKTLSPARHQLFGEITYPFTPLIKGMFSSIYNPNDQSIFYSPGLDISLTEDLDLLLTAQIFSGESGTEFGGYGSMYYLRFKYSF